MLKYRLLDAPVFSFRVGPSEEDGGEAVFGGIDETAYTGKIEYAPVRRKAYWEVELEKISFGTDELELENTGAAIDTGKFLLVLLSTRLSNTTLYRYLIDCPPHRHCGDAECPDRSNEILERPIHRELQQSPFTS